LVESKPNQGNYFVLKSSIWLTFRIVCFIINSKYFLENMAGYGDTVSEWKLFLILYYFSIQSFFNFLIVILNILINHLKHIVNFADGNAHLIRYFLEKDLFVVAWKVVVFFVFEVIVVDFGLILLLRASLEHFQMTWYFLVAFLGN